MSQLVTIVVLDSDAAGAQQALSSEQAILVHVSTVEQFRHFINRAACDVWLCDLSMDGLDFQADIERARQYNPNARVVLTGPAYLSSIVSTLLQQGTVATFVPKPWQIQTLRQAVFAGAPEAMSSVAAPPTSTAPRTPGKTGTITMAGKPVHQLTIQRAKPATGGLRIVKSSSGSGSAPERKPVLRLAPPKGPKLRPRQAAAPQPVAAGALEEPRYRLDELLGEGGVGKVYLAHDLLLDTKVAIKVLRPDFISDPSVLQALKDEARICMQLTHPNIVRFYDYGQRAGRHFLVMEYVQGQSLYDLLQIPESSNYEYVRNVAISVGSALSYAHAHGVLHNDITPGNILIGSDGVVKLIDFGIASAANQYREKTQYIFGTPSYMSPEQLRCDPVLDATTDVFALGVLLHQMLTGLLPQEEDATNEDLALRPRPSASLLPTPLAAVIDRALAFDPADRWRSASELVAAFDGALSS